MWIQRYGKIINTFCSNIMILILTLYRAVISPILPPSCRFYPSCSSYAIQALLKHGFVKGTCLAVLRILKCHPFNKGGFDPVPDNFPVHK